ncbi:hypothetical protein QW131_07665 [Roseibium salinum]|nr:hypothetical protein [Roseibium salinum]
MTARVRLEPGAQRRQERGILLLDGNLDPLLGGRHMPAVRIFCRRFG